MTEWSYQRLPEDSAHLDNNMVILLCQDKLPKTAHIRTFDIDRLHGHNAHLGKKKDDEDGENAII